ncbi:hypothetical protein PNOK_0319000 [Pyrrhoderma noxium]|uniref:Uncharacterized protein n=1 Tax=Pyrrhoderma noxium TaxID=2282107 RepID=A0A286ULT7_9AGAM|nr:hypothetical protein PNOK_0319000 [Pyrrhoderma noxium]
MSPHYTYLVPSNARLEFNRPKRLRKHLLRPQLRFNCYYTEQSLIFPSVYTGARCGLETISNTVNAVIIALFGVLMEATTCLYQ